MSKVSVFTVLTMLFFLVPTPAQAECPLQGGYCHQTLNCLEFHADEYGNKVTSKAGSGLANTVAALALVDVAREVSDGIFIAGTNPCKRVVYGVTGGLEGVGQGVYRLGAGLFELASSPFPFLGPVRYPDKNYFDEYREPVAYGGISPFATMNVVPD